MGPRYKLAFALLAGIAVLAFAVEIVLALRGRGEDARAAQVREAVGWPPSCADVVIHDRSPNLWPHAEVNSLIECEHLGPAVRYARFWSGPQLRDDLLAEPPSAPVCIAGREVLVDILDPGQFAPLCRRFHGEIVDAVSRLPDVPTRSPTLEEIDRATDEQHRRDLAAQREALRRFWHR